MTNTSHLERVKTHLWFCALFAACSSGGSLDLETPKSDGPEACSDLYDPETVPVFNIEISDSELRGLRRDCEDREKQYRPITLHYGKESVPAMVRNKGNWSWICDKMQFVVSFNETDKGGRFHGQRKLVFDAPWYDPTLLHERMAFHYQEQRGGLYSCVNNAKVNLNGEYYGLYANVERLDREYLERHFDDPDGNLFKEGRFLKTNESWATTATVDAFWETDDVEELGQLVDIPQALDVWAGLAMIPDPDSYWAGVEINFYLYEHPSRGLLFLPYDSDVSFAENIWPDSQEMDPITHEHPEWEREEQYVSILSDPTWCAQYIEALKRARAHYDVEALEATLRQFASQIRPALEDDPNRTFSMAEHDEALELMLTFPQRRADFIDAWLSDGEHCPVRWP